MLGSGQVLGGRGGPGPGLGSLVVGRERDELEADGEPYAVLLVEDDRVNQLIGRRALQRMGFLVDVAEHGAAAVRMVQERAYALVIMDCMMPVMDGFAATRAIRALRGAVAAVPIVALTANVESGARERCIDAGMDGYVAKPAGLDELREVLLPYLAKGETC